MHGDVRQEMKQKKVTYGFTKKKNLIYPYQIMGIRLPSMVYLIQQNYGAIVVILS